MKFHDLTARKINGVEVPLSTYRGKVVLVVNTASKCGLTPQFKELEALYTAYRHKGFEILGFPSNQFASQDPGSNEEIQNFCQLNYGVTFPMFEKIDVNGENAHPVYQFLKSQPKGKSLFSSKIKWNFTKFLVDQDGEVIKRYAPTFDPKGIGADLDKLLGL